MPGFSFFFHYLSYLFSCNKFVYQEATREFTEQEGMLQEPEWKVGRVQEACFRDPPLPAMSSAPLAVCSTFSACNNYFYGGNSYRN